MNDYTRLKDIDLKTTVGTITNIIGILTDVEDAETKQNKPYAKVTIVDKDVTLTAAIWDLDLVHLPTVKSYVNQLVVLGGKAKPFGNGVSYSVHSVKQMTDERIAELNLGLNISMFYNVIENRDELVKNMNIYLTSIQQTLYGKITIRALQNNWDKFTMTAAGKSMHHSGVGGLLQHTVEVIKITDTLYNLSIDLGYAVLCRPLLIAGAALHDIGKCKEISTSATGVSEYTNDSVLESHLMSGIAMVTEAATQLGFQHSVECAELCHVIAAHHEQKDWGQIKEASLIEAVLVSKADYTSALLNATSKNIGHTKPGEQYAAFGYNRNWVRSMGSFNDDMQI